MKKTPLRRGKPLQRKAGTARGTPVKKRNAKRRASEFQRAYGGQERADFIRSLPCSVVHCLHWPSENAHAAGGGTGRKSDAMFILPLCRMHHFALHTIGVQTFQSIYHIDLRAAAAATEQWWQSHVQGERAT